MGARNLHYFVSPRLLKARNLHYFRFWPCRLLGQWPSQNCVKYVDLCIWCAPVYVRQLAPT